MQTVDRVCKEDFLIVDESFTSFLIEKGKKYKTSTPKLDRVIVFGKYWVSVPLRIFGLNNKQKALKTIRSQPFF